MGFAIVRHAACRRAAAISSLSEAASICPAVCLSISSASLGEHRFSRSTSDIWPLERPTKAPKASIVILRALRYSVMVMWTSSDIPNAKSIGDVRFLLNDQSLACPYYPNMANAPRHDWYLKAWMATCKVKQSDIMRETGYSKATMSDLFTGKQRFNRDILNEIAHVLNIRPYELLMHPDEAMAIRRVRESAARIVADAVFDEPEMSAENSAVRTNRT
jgi:transcriptional regulator with XRE-family HTH domain